ncbi:hypothetical protein Hanom_Chr00s094265g01800421 [Helianthus anomalus]
MYLLKICNCGNTRRYSLPSFRKFRPEIYLEGRPDRVLANRRGMIEIEA